MQKCRSSGEQWKVVKELLHSSDSDKSRCESENLSLCSTFSSFFHKKIQSLKLAIFIKLSTFHYFSTPSDQPYTGSTHSSFPSVTTAEALTIMILSSSKSSPMYFIPSSLIKSCPVVFLQIQTTLANLPISQDIFPSRFKLAQVTPLLKKPSLDKGTPSNYRPISNLNNISKLLERLILNRIRDHISSCSNFNPFQSAYRKYYSTETALLLALANIYSSIDQGSSTFLVSLDLSSAFDIIYHNILLIDFKPASASLTPPLPGFAHICLAAVNLFALAQPNLPSPIAL